MTNEPLCLDVHPDGPGDIFPAVCANQPDHEDDHHTVLRSATYMRGCPAQTTWPRETA